MIDALIAGRLHGKPAPRTASNGSPFATAKVRTTARDGTTYFVNVICFEEAAIAALLALADGDSVAIAGELTVKIYQPQNGDPRASLDLTGHAVLTQYHVSRRRQAMEAT